MPSSYCLFEFSTGYFVSLGSNSVFYRKTKIKCNLAILRPCTMLCFRWVWLVGFWFFTFLFYGPVNIEPMSNNSKCLNQVNQPVCILRTKAKKPKRNPRIKIIPFNVACLGQSCATEELGDSCNHVCHSRSAILMFILLIV